jgi:DNA polymerase-3 subunit gamma/tau
LLDLIEQFAAAEGRMKWAPNKKMHLEIAVIRAVQMLSQTTLTEVIETLTELRGGAPAPPRNAPPPVTRKPLSKPVPAAQPVTAKAPASEATPVVRETPAPAAATPAKVLQEPAEIWGAVIAAIRTEGHSLRLWASSGELLRIDGDTAVIGFSGEQTLAAGHCEERANRAYLEGLLTRFAGRPLQVRVELREGLEVKSIPHARPAAAPAAPERDPMEEFKQDPLILKALELFKAEIQ